MSKIKAAIYCRVTHSGDEDSLVQLCNRQKNILMEKAAASNYEVTECYQDIGYSGSDMDRPGLQRMLRDHKDGRFSIVLVYNHDRLLKGNPTEIPNWPFRVLSATPISDSERESERLARYMRSAKTNEKTMAQQRRAVRRTAKKHGYR